ncbi:LppA family lipoprotein [Streptomyces sp. NPDC006923]|uniref:LppA family lipoprotein n=1 Tax=Streptomyces sp. NPDC006923 TaxID=3155355 RepID=UPI0033F72C23
MTSACRAMALLSLFLASGCSLLSETSHLERNPSGVNMQQAAEKADAIMQETLSDISPELRWMHGPSNDRMCTDRKSDSTGTGSVRRRVAVTTLVSEERRGNLLGVVERNWKARGFEITSVDADKDLPAIYAVSPEDFGVSVAAGGGGQIFFSVTTPCFAESEVSAPATGPNSAQRSDEYPPRPDVHDDFWSSSGPLPTSSPSAP